MGETTNTNSVSASDDIDNYLEIEFLNGGNYTGFGNFKTFAIKVVMTSADTTKVPLIKDLRVIALA